VARDLLIVGLNHRTTPVALREQLAFPETALGAALGQLKSVPGVHEAAIISTCNRIEVVACIAGEPADVGGGIEVFLAREREVERSAFATTSTCTTGGTPSATSSASLRAWTRWWSASRRSSAR